MRGEWHHTASKPHYTQRTETRSESSYEQAISQKNQGQPTTGNKRKGLAILVRNRLVGPEIRSNVAGRQQVHRQRNLAHWRPSWAYNSLRTQHIQSCMLALRSCGSAHSIILFCPHGRRQGQNTDRALTKNKIFKYLPNKTRDAWS